MLQLYCVSLCFHCVLMPLCLPSTVVNVNVSVFTPVRHVSNLLIIFCVSLSVRNRMFYRPQIRLLSSRTTCFVWLETNSYGIKTLVVLSWFNVQVAGFSLTTTPMLPFESLEASICHLWSSNVWPRSLWMASPESPLKFKPFLVKSSVFLSICCLQLSIDLLLHLDH